ncbi:hypothetical protein [Paraburkholderia fungorum]|nr:hypothetical protein [Paraburkholderia fungorum]
MAKLRARANTGKIDNRSGTVKSRGALSFCR